jgi:hypothetical protein
LSLPLKKKTAESGERLIINRDSRLRGNDTLALCVCARRNDTRGLRFINGFNAEWQTAKTTAKWIPAKNEALLRFIFASMTTAGLGVKRQSLPPPHRHKIKKERSAAALHFCEYDNCGTSKRQSLSVYHIALK